MSEGEDPNEVRETRGDLVLTAQITERAAGASSAGAGLMFRESLDPKVKFAAMLIEKSTARFRTRPTLSKVKTSNELPLWIRLERKGDEFIGSISSDGCAWTEVGRKTIQGFPEAMLVGLAATGNDPGATTSSFQAVQARICVADPPPCGTPFRRGDSNADGATDISDAVAILSYLFLGINKVPCEQAGDVNDDGALDISDAVYVLSFLFLGGKAIEPPVGSCGVDPTGHDLPCESFPGCQ